MGSLIGSSKIFFKRNGSTILTCIGAVGVVATGVAAAKATPKAMMLLEEAKEEKGEELTTVQKVIVAGPAYIPAIAIGVSTIACIFGANILNKRQQAALMSAYAVLDSSYKQYRVKVNELLGEEADKEIKGEIAKDGIDKEKRPSDGKQLFFDFFSMQYFESTLADVFYAEYEFNKLFADRGYASLNELYKMLGVGLVEYGEEFGWSYEAGGAFYGYSWIDFKHEMIMLDDGLECCVISTPFEPTNDYLGY